MVRRPRTRSPAPKRSWTSSPTPTKARSTKRSSTKSTSCWRSKEATAMDDEMFPRDKQPGESTEGVRIIGAEEAEKAIEREDVARRLPRDAPRYGDRPEGPPEDAPRPAIRFPLSGSSDPTEIERPPVVPADPLRTSGEHRLPHWTEPATGEVPKVLASSEEDDDDLDAWSSFTSSQPRWRGEGPPVEREEFDDFSRLADDET